MTQTATEQDSSTAQIVTTRIDEAGIATVTLNRPEKLNALNDAMFHAIAAAGEALKREPALRAVILTGAGQHFCAGLDTSNFANFAKDMDETRRIMRNPPAGEVANFFQKPCFVWQELEVPVIAALRGVAFGGGLQIALAADFRLAAPDVRLSVMEAKWGIIPDMGITQNLPKLLRADQAKDLMMTARIVEAQEASELGLVTRIVDDPLAAAQAYAADLVQRNPEAIRGIKRLVEQSWTAAPGAALALEGEIQSTIIGGPNQMEAVMAVMQKRPPKFR